MKKILQITSGRGPAECCWVVAQVLKLLIEEARDKGIEATVLFREPGEENNTLVSALLQLKGNQVEEFSKTWMGTIQWIGQSEFRKTHKRKNWFVGINQIEFTGNEFEIEEREISYRAIRSGGPGGQHLNKVSTAIRATHLPTGLTVVASDSRSQIQNKKKARERLLVLLEAKSIERKTEAAQANWQNHNELKRGNPVRVFTGTDFRPRPIEKTYKSKRHELKRELRNRIQSE